MHSVIDLIQAFSHRRRDSIAIVIYYEDVHDWPRASFKCTHLEM